MPADPWHGRRPEAPCPGARVATEDETASVLSRVATRWGVQGRVWYPNLQSGQPPDHANVLERDAFEPNTAALEALVDAVVAHGITQVLELPHYGPDLVLDVEALRAGFSGTKCLWADREGDFLLFVSYDDSVAIGPGWVMAALAEAGVDTGTIKWDLTNHR